MTVVVNLFGGPGTGKSTTAAGLFAYMKEHGLRVELVTEYAKDLTYEKADLSNQMAILGEQDRRLRRLLPAGLDFIITDSPLLLSLVYAQGDFKEGWFTGAVLGCIGTYRNINILLERTKPYQAYGRSQTEDEAKALDGRIRGLIEGLDIPHQRLVCDTSVVRRIYDEVILYA